MSTSTFTLQIKNDSGQFNNKQVYIFMSGIDPNNTTPVTDGNGHTYSTVFSAAEIDSSGNVSLKQIPGNPSEYSSWNAKNYSYLLSDIGGGTDGTVTLKIPQIKSARIYLSIEKALDRPVIPGYSTKAHKIPTTLSFEGLQPFNQSAANYLTLYDKVELTFTDDAWIDTTSVDFFCLPITLSKTDGTDLRGLTQSRSTVFDTLKKGLTGEWAKLPLAFNGSDLRVLAPASATGNAISSKDFDKSYMNTYIDAIWKYYAEEGNSISINCDEVTCSGTDTKAGTYTGSTSAKSFDFSGGACGDISIPSKPTSLEFFQCTNGPLTATDKTPLSVVVKCLAAAWNLGILPMEGTLVDDDPSSFKGTWYANNAALKNLIPGYKDSDIYYNLYAGLIHSLKYPDNSPILTYAFPYDDVLGASGTIQVAAADIPTTPIVLTIRDMSKTKLPDTNDNTQYDVTFHLPSAKTVSGEFNSDTPNLEPGGNPSFSDVKSPFSFKYDNGDGTGMQECTVDVMLNSFVPQTHGSINSVKGTAVSIGLAASAAKPNSKTGWDDGATYSVTLSPGAGGSGYVMSGKTKYTFSNLAKGKGQNATVPGLISPIKIYYTPDIGGTPTAMTIDLANNSSSPAGAVVQTKAQNPAGPFVSLPGGGWTA